MTLMTPPHSRFDKENRCAARSMSARVAWSQVNEYHSATSPVCKRKFAASASKELPVRSILKQTSYPILPLLFPENERQVTPEPGDPLSDLHYLDRPVNKILAHRSTLLDLIEAYSVLTARLRAAVQETTDSNCSWPLFQPIQKRRLAFVDSVIRDLGRALVDPMEGDDQLGCLDPEPPSVLPSPEKSPRKRRCGMDEEQVKYARDLATVSHAVIKFLGLVFTLPAVYALFDGSLSQFHLHFLSVLTSALLGLDLGSMVTQALAIPLAPELPTPNSRKTCALAIWLLQTQRLPADVLAPAKDRITYALRRAIEGELGKEGKRGSASDGMKVSRIACHWHWNSLGRTDCHLCRPSTIFPFKSPLFSCLRSPNCSLPSSIIFLHLDLLCELRRAMHLVAWPSARPRFPSRTYIRGSPTLSTQYLQILLHHRQLHLLAHPAPENPTRCLLRHCARRWPRTIHHALRRAPSGHSARSLPS